LSEPEALPPDVWIIASLKEILEAQKVTNQQLLSMQNELISIRKSQEKSDIHLKLTVDLSVAHSDSELVDFVTEGLEIDSAYVMPVPSAVSLKFRGVEDETVDLNAGDDYSLSGHVITQIFVTNTAGTGTATIHVYGRRR
jgi:hypothetical protein